MCNGGLSSGTAELQNDWRVFTDTRNHSQTKKSFIQCLEKVFKLFYILIRYKHTKSISLRFYVMDQHKVVNNFEVEIFLTV